MKDTTQQIQRPEPDSGSTRPFQFPIFRWKLPLLAALLALLSTVTPQLSAALMGTAFTYQGQLTDGTNPADGRFDLTFTLYDDSIPARLVAGPITNSSVAVSDGLFTVVVDFGAEVFGAQARWLAIGVRPFGGRDFTTLSPRQRLTPTPQAFYALDAGDAVRLGGQSAASFAPAAGSSNYVAIAGDTMTGPLVVPANGFRAGTDQLVLTGENVGIGTTSPGALLGLLGDAGGDQILVHARGSHTAGSWLSLENTSTDGKRWDFISTGAGNGGGAGNLLFRQATVGSVVTLTPGARVGVGTLSPISKLDVVDEAGTEPTLIRAGSPRTAGTWLGLVNTDTGGKRWDFISTGSGNSGGAGNLVFRQQDVGHVMTLTPEGRVGVGTDSPANKLNVVGEPGVDQVLIGAQGSHTDGAWLSLQSTDFGGKRWNLISTGSGNSGGAGNLLFGEAGVGTVLTLGANERVGINDTSPDAALDIVTSENIPALRLKASYQPNGWASLEMEEGGGHSAVLTTWYGDEGGVVATRAGFHMSDGTHFYMMDGGHGAECNETILADDFIARSDRNVKTRIEPANTGEVLERVLALPVSTWVFTNKLDQPHMGPMAQDFHAAFGLGNDDKTLSARDVASVGLAAIQGLNRKVEDRSQKLEAENSALKQELAELKALVRTLAAKVNGGMQ